MEDAGLVYIQKWIHKMAIVLLVIGALNWGLLGLNRVNVVERLIGKGLARGVYVLVGLAALLVAFNRDTYLPFLGESVFPCSILQDQIPAGATRTVQVRVEPNAKVIYWASEPTANESVLQPYNIAYGKYLNAGVTTADHNGFAILKVREPQAYRVPWKGALKPHVHFRTCGPTGFIGRIRTVFLHDGHVEGFMV
jgi:uncharacterized membrane protein YuzA (DUF378 family)